MKQMKLSRRMSSPLAQSCEQELAFPPCSVALARGNTVDVLGQSQKSTLPLRQFRQSEMCWVGFRPQGHMSSITVELPY